MVCTNGTRPCKVRLFNIWPGYATMRFYIFKCIHLDVMRGNQQLEQMEFVWNDEDDRSGKLFVGYICISVLRQDWQL